MEASGAITQEVHDNMAKLYLSPKKLSILVTAFSKLAKYLV